MELDRLELLENIKQEIGMGERDADEFTANEIADSFGINKTNVVQFLDTNEIEYTRRKALADGRRQYVYKILRGENDIRNI